MTEKTTPPDSLGAASCSACDGCQWQHEGESGDWCYMFGYRPVMLPCTQHDKFKETRDMISAVVRKRPEILAMMAMAHSEPNGQLRHSRGPAV